MGMIGPRMGKHWIIQNCRVTNARYVGIILGHASGVDYGDIDAYGDHIIRNNVIRRCTSPPSPTQHIGTSYGPSQPLMNVGVVGLQEPRISVTLYTSKTYLLSATQTPTQRSDRS